MALEDLVRLGPPPRPKRKREPSIQPVVVDGATWFYPMPKGMVVVHEVREKDRYIRTDQFTIKWSAVRLEHGKLARVATKPQPAIRPSR